MAPYGVVRYSTRGKYKRSRWVVARESSGLVRSPHKFPFSACPTGRERGLCDLPNEAKTRNKLQTRIQEFCGAVNASSDGGRWGVCTRAGTSARSSRSRILLLLLSGKTKGRARSRGLGEARRGHPAPRRFQAPESKRYPLGGR